MTRKHRIFNIIVFLFIIFAIPITQLVIDATNKEIPQAFNLFTAVPRPFADSLGHYKAAFQEAKGVGILAAPFTGLVRFYAAAYPTFEKNLRAYENELEDRSFIENAVRPPVQYVQYAIGRDPGAKAVKGKDDWLFYTPGIDYLTGPYYNDSRYLTPAGGDPKADWDVKAAIVDFRDQLQGRGVDLLVVPMPGKGSILPEKATARRIEDIRDVHAHTARLIDELCKQGIEVVDLFEAFLKDKEENNATAEQPLYLKRDTHWTGRAVRIAAKVIADRVKQYDWYNNSLATWEYEVRDTVIERYGDIGQMTKIPRNEMLFPKQKTIAYRVYEKESGNPHRDKKDSPILWLGDSFSRIYRTDNPKSAGITAHLAHELKMPLTAIVNDGGASTLVRQQLARRMRKLNGKKLVIWEFVERDIVFGMENWQQIALK